MDFEGALRARITGASTSAGSRVYWDERPQGADLPAVTLQMIDGARSQHLQGYESVQRPLVQIDCWADSFGGAKTLMDAVLTTVVPANNSNGIRFDRAIEDRRGSGVDRSGDRQVFRQSADLGMWWATA